MIEKEEKLKLKDFLTVAEFPGYLLLIMPVLSLITTRQRDVSAHTTIDASAFIQILLVFLSFTVAFYFLFLSKKDNPVLLFRSPQIYLYIYILICFISMIWSPNVFITGYRAFESLTYLMLITLVVQRLISRLSYQNIIEWAILWITWSIFWSVIGYVKWAGISYLLWPFRSARLEVPIFFFIAIFLSKRRYLKYLIIAFTLLSISNKVYFGIAFGMLGFFFGNVKYRVLFLIIGFGLAISFALWGEMVLQNTVFYGRVGIGMEYTSGRNMIWEVSWEHYLHKPFLGYGFVAGENDLLFSNFKGVITTHNFILSGLIGTGMLGAIFLIIYFTSAFKTAVSSVFESGKWKIAFVSTIIMATIISFTAPGVGARVYGSWMPVVFVISLISGLQFKAKESIGRNDEGY